MNPAHSSRRVFPRRWPMLRLTDKLISLLPEPKNKKGVLILRLFGIGDALLFRAVLEKYAEALNIPLNDVTILGSTAWTSAADLFFKDIRVIFIDERRFARNFFYRLRIMANLRQRGFKTAICGMRFRYPHVVESLMLASGADQRIVVEPRPNEKFDAMFAHYLPLMTKVIPLPEAEKPRGAGGEPLPLGHEITQQLAFLSAVAGRPIKLAALPKLPIPRDPAPLVSVHKRYAVLNIGASHAPRRWPLAGYFEIARRLLEQDYAVVFLGGPAEIGLKDAVNAFTQQEKKDRIIVSIGELDLTAAAHLINKAALVLSNDSGLGHLSIMLERPSVLIVGGGHFGSFMPYPSSLTAAHAQYLNEPMSCYHCNWNCSMMPPGGTTFPCIGGVTVEHVWQALGDIMNLGDTMNKEA